MLFSAGSQVRLVRSLFVGKSLIKEHFLFLLAALVRVFLLCSLIITQRGNSKRKIDFILNQSVHILYKDITQTEVAKNSINDI